jgi:acetamidase/formamidase
MQLFRRESVREHCAEREWPEFLGAVGLGESFVVETERFNASNGPIEVRGVRSGEPVAVHIERIGILPPFESPNGGPFVEGMGPPVRLELRDGYFHFPQGYRLMARPSIGNLAVLPRPDDDVLNLSRRSLAAPERYPDFRGWRRVVNDPRGKHCHQDCQWSIQGAVVHLRTQVDGAGICVADVHGYIGQGEMAFAGIEVAADVQLRVERSTGWFVDWPLIETDGEIMVFCSHRGQERYVDVVREAYRALREVVAARIGCSVAEANPIVASAVDIRNCALYGLQGFVPQDKRTQDGDIAVVAALPKDVFHSWGETR